MIMISSWVGMLGLALRCDRCGVVWLVAPSAPPGVEFATIIEVARHAENCVETQENEQDSSKNRPAMIDRGR